MDANLLHISYEGRALEDPAQEAEEDMWRWTVSPERAPDAAETIELGYARGDIVSVNGKAMTPAQVLTELNRLGGKHGIGRLDLVENRYVGMADVENALELLVDRGAIVEVGIAPIDDVTRRRLQIAFGASLRA